MFFRHWWCWWRCEYPTNPRRRSTLNSVTPRCQISPCKTAAFIRELTGRGSVWYSCSVNKWTPNTFVAYIHPYIYIHIYPSIWLFCCEVIYIYICELSMYWDFVLSLWNCFLKFTYEPHRPWLQAYKELDTSDQRSLQPYGDSIIFVPSDVEGDVVLSKVIVE